MSGIPTITKNVPFLEKPSDWTPWLRNIRLSAQSHGIWKYASPDSTEEFRQLTEADRADAGDVIFRALVNENQEQKKQLRILSSRIVDTISTGYQARIPDDCEEPRERLQALKKSVGMTDRLREQMVEERLEKLLKGV